MPTGDALAPAFRAPVQGCTSWACVCQTRPAMLNMSLRSLFCFAVSRQLWGAALMAALAWGFLPTASAADRPLKLVAAGISSSDETAELPCGKVYLLLAKEALRRADIDFVCEALPWRRAQAMVQLGRQDAMVTLATEERAKYSVASTETLYRLQLRGFTSASHPRRAELALLETIDQLRPWQLLSYLGDGWARAHLENAGFQVAWSRDLATVLKQLAAQRGDLCISAEVEAMPLIHAMGIEDQVIMLPEVLDTLEFKIQISKLSPHLSKLPVIDAAIRSMHADGTIERISREAALQAGVR
jgi:polar amino acid transport system substrate-binding protein